MPKVDLQAVLDARDIKGVMATARKTGPLAFALTAWCYEFGARAAEPGLQLLKDVDVRARRARPAHLKGGKAQAWHALLPFCREALPPWLTTRPTTIKKTEQQVCLFPSGAPGRCYTCQGTGKRTTLRRDGKRRFAGERVPCHHCGATGKRWGLSRQETYAIVSGVLTAAGMPVGRRHPHVLRHSIITHMLDGGTSPNVVQDRVGHKLLSTTLEYSKFTESAAADLEEQMEKVYG
jgi:site-specific recombinase XerD